MSFTTTTTATTNGTTLTSPPKAVLVISLAKHLHGTDISIGIAKDWALKATPAQQHRFDNQGFNLDPTDEERTLSDLRATLQGRKWDGVLVGWCTRGNKEFTVLFEKVVGECVREVVRREKGGLGERDEGLKLIFNNGADDLVMPTFRAFGAE